MKKRICASTVFRLVLSAAVVASPSCRPSDKEPAFSTVVAPKKLSLLQTAQARASSRRKVTAAEFVATNPQGWVGRAHNRYLKEALREVARSASERNKCRIVDRVLRRGKWLAEDSLRMTRNELERAADLAISRIPQCVPRKRAVRNTALAVPTGPTLRVDDVTPYNDAILEAAALETDLTTFASAVSAIAEDAAENLTGTDLDLFNANASVAVASAIYWSENGASELTGLNGSQGDPCVNAPPQLDGICDEELPMSWHDRSTQGSLFRTVAASRRSVCPFHWNKWHVVGGDVAGAIVGGIVGGLGGAIVVGAGVSAAVFLVEGWRDLYCNYHT